MKQIDRQALKQWEEFHRNFASETSIDLSLTAGQIDKLRKELEADPVWWCRYMFPKYATAPFAPFHIKAIKRITSNDEWYEVLSWSRELAKSTVVMMTMMYLALTGRKRFFVLTSATSGIIAFEGKLYRVSTHSLGQTEQSNEFFWLFSEREDGDKTFEDGNEHPTQRLCTAELLSTREAPSSGKYIDDSDLPRLGIDIAPKPRFFKDFRYESTLGQLVDFRELSPYSGILTLRFAPKESLPKDGYFATGQPHQNKVSLFL